MSISISNIAKQIASRLDSTDKDGRNNKIDSDKWNSFAKGKGKSIKRYIDVNTAAKSISIYLRKEAKKCNGNISDIGQNWLAQLDGVFTKEVVLDEVVITSKKETPVDPNTPDNKNKPELASNTVTETEELSVKSDSEEISSNITASAESTKVNSGADQTISRLTTNITPSYNELVGISQPVAPPEPDDYEPIESDETELLSDLSKPYDMRAEFMISSRYTMYAIKNKGYFANISNELYEKIIQSISSIKEEHISTATIIKNLKENLLGDIRKAFKNNNNQVYRFIYSLAKEFTKHYCGGTEYGTRDAIVATAKSYCDANIKTQAEGNIYFSDGARRAWCADTVSTILLDAVKEELPDDFVGTSSVSNLRAWGKKHNSYTETSVLGANARKNFIASNVKPGDIMIEKRHKSHTGIVIEVAPDGSWFKTVEGNTSKSVSVRTYSSNSRTLSGFISMEKYLAEKEADTVDKNIRNTTSLE